MLTKKEKRFVKTLMPHIKIWASKWFKPGATAPSGLKYGCWLCDSPDFGTPERHEEHCLYQRSKDVLEEIENEKNNVPKMENPITGKFFSKKRQAEWIEWYTYRAILKHLYEKRIFEAIPLDYKDYKKSSVVCSCWRGSAKNRTHTKNCHSIVLSKALILLIKI